MSNEHGIIAIKASDSIHELFSAGNVKEALLELADYSKVDRKVFINNDWDVGGIRNRSGYICLSHDFGEWTKISDEFLKKSFGIEYYAHHSEEYGGQYFYSIPNDSERYYVDFQFEGDMMKDEAYQEEIRTKLEDLIASIPLTVKKVYPDFGEIDVDALVGN